MPERSDRLRRGFRTGHAGHVENPGEVVVGAVDAEDGVGQTLLRPDDAKEPAGKPAAEDVVHDPQGEVVGIIPDAADVAEDDRALVDVVLPDQAHRTVVGIVDLGQIGPDEPGLLPSPEYIGDLLYHIVRVEIPPHAEHGIVRVEPGLVKGHEVIPGNGVDGGVLGMPRVNALRPVDQLAVFPEAHVGRVVVPTGDRGSFGDFLQFDLVFGKGGMHENVRENGQHGIHVVLQDRHEGGSGNQTDLCLDGRAQSFQRLVDLVARHAGGPTRAHH